MAFPEDLILNLLCVFFFLSQTPEEQPHTIKYLPQKTVQISRKKDI